MERRGPLMRSPAEEPPTLVANQKNESTATRTELEQGTCAALLRAPRSWPRLGQNSLPR